MIAYVDASVLLRIVLSEPDPLPEWEDLEPIASELIRVECLRVIDRLRLLGAVTDAVVAERRTAISQLLAAFDLVSLSRPILERAADPFPTHVATLDALHLASAVELRAATPNLAFATHDAQLAIAARALDFVVLGTP